MAFDNKNSDLKATNATFAYLFGVPPLPAVSDLLVAVSDGF